MRRLRSTALDRFATALACAGLSLGPLTAAPELTIESQGGDVQLSWLGALDEAYWLQEGASLDTLTETLQPYLGTGSLIHELRPATGANAGFFRVRGAEVLEASDFSADLRTQGWTYFQWNDRVVFNSGGIAADGSLDPTYIYTWRSPDFDLPPFEYYRVDFQIQGSGDLWISGLGRYTSTDWGRFLSNNSEDKTLWDEDWNPYPATSEWVDHRYFTRVRANASASTVIITGFGNDSSRARRIVVTPATRKEVLEWADATYATMPVLDYTPPPGRHGGALDNTLAKLSSAQTVRIVMVGDSLVQDMGNSTIDVLLERAFPGSRVELVTCGASATGMQVWSGNDPPRSDADVNIVGGVIDQQPDLVLLGGISNDDLYNSFSDTIERIRDLSDAASQPHPEFIVATGPMYLRGGAPANHVTLLSQVAADRGAAFLDIYTAVDDYFTSNGIDPTTYSRDSNPLHANLIAKQLFGRVMLAWFTE